MPETPEEAAKAKSERIKRAVMKFETLLGEFEEAREELVSILRSEYKKAPRTHELHVSTGIGVSWISLAMNGKLNPKKPESLIAIARFFMK